MLARKKGAKIKANHSKFKNGEKPRMIHLGKQVDAILISDGEKYGRDLKNHTEFILRQYAAGNVKVKVEGTNIWAVASTAESEN